MSSDIFRAEIITSGRTLVSREVSQVILPAHDGEVGILPFHRDFAGLLGWGIVRMFAGGSEDVYMVGGGVWQVVNGTLSILAEIAREARGVDADESLATLLRLRGKLETMSSYDPAYPEMKRQVLEANACVTAAKAVRTRVQ